MNGQNKLLLPFGESCVIRTVVEVALEVEPAEVIVVLGHQREDVEVALGGLPARFIPNESFQAGMAGSIAAGIEATAPDSEGYLILLGDMPFVTRSLMAALAERGSPDMIVFPTVGGQQRNPVLFGRAFRNELRRVAGDHGARQVIARHEGATVGVPWSDESCFRDIDIPTDWAT